MNFLLTATAFAAALNLAKEKGFDFHGIVVEDSTFSRVEEAFGSNERKREGQGGLARMVSCYQAKDGAYVEFESNLERANGQVVSQLSIAEKKPAMRKCRVSKKFSRTSTFGNGLKLGLSEDAVIKLLGEPKEHERGSMSYSFERPLGRRFSEAMHLRLQFSGKKKVEEIVLHKVSSN